PPLVSAFCRRLHEAGMPVTPARAADLARALVLVRPIARRRLYWTARAVLVSDPADARAFDVVFREVFGDPRGAEPVAPGDPESAPAPAEDRPAGERAAGVGDPARDAPGAWSALASTSADEEDAAEVEMPLAVASDEERLAEKSFDALTPGELARLYELMSQLRLATPRRSTRRHVRDRHRRRSDPARPSPPPRRAPPAGDAVRHLRIDGAVQPRLPAVPRVRGGRRPQRRGLRVRDPADPAHPRARLAPARAGDAPGGRRRSGLVERHPHRRCAEGVQRPPRPPRHGPRGGGRDPVRRLGAGRPRPGRPRDGAA